MKLLVPLRREFYDALDTNTDASVARYRGCSRRRKGHFPQALHGRWNCL